LIGPPELDVERRWNRVGRNAAYVAGASFFVGTVLFLLDAADLLGKGPAYHATSAGPLQDEANFWVAAFEHQHGILWDIIARDLILPLGFVALIVLGLAVRHLVGSERPEGQLMVAFLVVGGVLSAIADLTFLADVEYWRFTGLKAHPPEIAVSIGRATQAIDTLTRWPEIAGFAVVAMGVLYLGVLCRTRPELPAAVGIVAFVEAALLVGVALAEAFHNDSMNQLFSLVTGVLIAPVLAFWLGRHFARLNRT
jgi:hydrogenase/urease accessory protein HupE